MNKVTIIAEAAQGYEGDPGLCDLYTRAAAACGADVIKFQIVYADELSTPDYRYYELYKTLEMSDEDWHRVAGRARELGIKIYFDGLGQKSVRMAEDVDADGIKIHATDIDNLALLSQVRHTKVNTILVGIGGATLSAIKRAIDQLEGKNIVLMHGFQGYPTEAASNQLSRIGFLKDSLRNHPAPVRFGFADHVHPPDRPDTFALPATAIGLGASVLEKHLTIARSLNLEDSEAALTSDEFGPFVRAMRASHDSLGSVDAGRDDLGMSVQERRYKEAIRRDVVTSVQIEAGTVLNASHVTLKRTSNDRALTEISDVYGRVSTMKIPANMALTKEMLQSDPGSHA